MHPLAVPAFQLADADGAAKGGLRDTAEQAVELFLRILLRPLLRLIVEEKIIFRLVEGPLDPVNAFSVSQAELPSVNLRVHPGGAARHQVVLSLDAARAGEAVEHRPDEGVDRGFPGFIGAVDDVDALREGEVKVMKFSKTVNMEIEKMHQGCLLSPAVRSRARTPA